METIRLKTNIKCGGCVAAVTPLLNPLAGAGNWQVDTQNPDKVLTVKTGGIPASAVQQADYKAGVLS